MHAQFNEIIIIIGSLPINIANAIYLFSERSKCSIVLKLLKIAAIEIMSTEEIWHESLRPIKQTHIYNKIFVNKSINASKSEAHSGS